jgi:hypothetical protein
MNLSVRLPNGEEVTGRTEEWLAAILLVLTDDQRAVVMDRIRRKMVAYQTPGSYLLQAEGLGSLIRGGR